MKNRSDALFFSHPLFALLFILSMSVSQKVYAEGQAPQAMPVQALEVNLQTLPYEKSYPATLSAYKGVEVHSRVNGILEQQFYKEGQTVEKGQKLYQIDKRRYLASVRQAQAQLKIAEVKAQQTKISYQRIKGLAKSRSVSEQDIDDAKANWDAAMAEILSAKASLNSAQIDLDDTIIRAEIDGVIGEKQLDVGDLVTANSTLLNRIVQTDVLYAQFSVSDSELKRQHQLEDQGLLKLQDSAGIKLLDDNDKPTMDGKMDYAASELDISTSTRLMRATFENPQSRLFPGQMVRVNVRFGEWQNVIAIPQKAVLQVGPQSFVYVVKDGVANLMPVQLASQYGDQWLVTGGLKPKDQIIIANLIKIRPKTPVMILPKTDAPKNAPPATKS
ncbi:MULTISPECIES: efflux RND transporter periplasmic adaptor subunit [Thiomicrorhabdus]|uniref:Efflux RND transporter periplasmic adaptor subunit n=1 Tax=Thiomicrorhabdus heinhorstiae TaxID=2748010 RepID=A0ABS0BWG2_9GAMM|nr:MULTISPECIES: efflux RND transporter periplasmic adaptor subunit [Thiomicrorhabdus]MBF6057744.1 efflux RND transporter periplasmic adaptor subunit [Thiomicrorhabdus heinhorstiae]